MSWDQGGECWFDLPTTVAQRPLGPWPRALIGGAQSIYGWRAPVTLRIK